MESPKKLPKKNNNDIKGFYSLNIRALWQGLRKEHISFWLLCIYFFFEYVRPQTLYPDIDVLPWTQIFLILTWITVFGDKSVHWVANVENKLFITFGLIIITSSIFAFDPTVSWDYRNVMLGWIAVYFLVITIVNTEKRLILFLLAYFLFNFKMAQFGTIEWARRGFTFESWGLTGTPGWFSNSGEYAIQMLIFGSLAMSFVVSLKKYWERYKKWFLFLAASFGFIAVMGASSRGSQIALAAIGIWLLLKQRGGFKGFILLILVSIALFYLLPEEQIYRFEAIGKDQSSLQRLAYWQAGVKIIKEYPVLGIGYNNWISYLSDLYPNGIGVMGTIQVSHNIYIQAGSELGITGLFCFLMMVVYAFIINARTRKIAHKLDNILLYNLTYGLDAGLIGYLVAGTFVTVLYYPFFWVQIAMIVMVNSIANRQQT